MAYNLKIIRRSRSTKFFVPTGICVVFSRAIISYRGVLVSAAVTATIFVCVNMAFINRTKVDCVFASTYHYFVRVPLFGVVRSKTLTLVTSLLASAACLFIHKDSCMAVQRQLRIMLLSAVNFKQYRS